jgi:hypothetical protein
MACGALPHPDLPQVRHLGPARPVVDDARGDRGTARVEATPRRDRARVRRLAGQDRGSADLADARGDLQQGLGVGMEWRGQDLLRGAELDDLSEVHDRYAIGHRPRDPEIVGDQYEGEPQLVLELGERPQDLAPDRRVEH